MSDAGPLRRLRRRIRGCRGFDAAAHDLHGQTVLVTGGNSGIGKHIAVGLARTGADVIITSRDEQRGQRAVEEIRARSGSDRVDVRQLDLASLANIRKFADGFRAEHDRLDVLVNNAGLMQTERSETEDGFETSFGVNHLGHFLLTNLLLDLIVASAPARIVVVASAAHRQGSLDFDDLQSERSYTSGLGVYATSKLANMLFARELARRLEGRGVNVYAVHPGTVRSGFGMDGDSSGLLRLGLKLARPFFLSPEQGARTPVYAAVSPEVADETGRYYSRCTRKQPSAAARDDADARRLWEVSEQLVGLAPSAR